MGNTVKGPGGLRGILTVEQREEYANHFVRLDINGDGWLSREECARWIRGRRRQLSNQQMEAIFRLIDVDEDGRITFDEFLTVMEFNHQPLDKNENAHMTFQKIDRNKDGFLTEEEILDSLRDSGYSVTEKQIHKFVTRLDRNHNGKISFEEFLRAFQ